MRHTQRTYCRDIDTLLWKQDLSKNEILLFYYLKGHASFSKKNLYDYSLSRIDFLIYVGILSTILYRKCIFQFDFFPFFAKTAPDSNILLILKKPNRFPFQYFLLDQFFKVIFSLSFLFSHTLLYYSFFYSEVRNRGAFLLCSSNFYLRPSQLWSNEL